MPWFGFSGINEEGGNMNSGIVVLIFIVYFVPFLIANHRHHKNQVPIFFLNLIFGWTIIGWVGALVWASMAENRRVFSEK